MVYGRETHAHSTAGDSRPCSIPRVSITQKLCLYDRYLYTDLISYTFIMTCLLFIMHANVMIMMHNLPDEVSYASGSPESS